MTKNKKIIKKTSLEKQFPELPINKDGLYDAIKIVNPNAIIDNDLFDKVIWSFDFLVEKRTDYFVPPKVDTDDIRGFYKKTNADFSNINFDDYLEYIIEFLIFSQEFSGRVRKKIERYYKEKGGRIDHRQHLNNLKLAELIFYIVIGPGKRCGTEGRTWSDFARISIPKCYFVLNSVFCDAMKLEMKCLEDENNFKDIYENYLQYYNLDEKNKLSYYDVIYDEDKKIKKFIKTNSKK